MKPLKNSERGQIVVLLVLVVIGLLGFTALAIDGSMIFSDRRFTQSVADSASLAGGNIIKDTIISARVNDIDFYCPLTSDVTTLGGDILNAIADGFNTALDRADEYYPQLPDITVTSADMTFDAGIYRVSALTVDGNDFYVSCDEDDESLTVYVQLTSQTDTAFMHLISNQVARNTVEAETRIIAQQSLTGGNTIISLSQDCSNKGGGVYISGGPTMDLIDGGTCSNSCLYIGGASGLDLSSDGPLTYDVTSDLTIVGNPDLSDVTIESTDSDCMNPSDFQETFDQLYARCEALRDDDGGNFDVVQEINGVTTYFQGFHDTINQNNGEMFLNPGLYCIDPKKPNDPAISLTGGKVIANDVTIVIMAGQGVTINGNSGVDEPVTFTADLDWSPQNNVLDGSPITLTGWCKDIDSPDLQPYEDDGTCPSGYAPEETPNQAEATILFYIPLNVYNKNTLTLNGTSSTTFEGIIYAPNTVVSLSGSSTTGSVDFGVAVIGYDVTLSGTSDTNFLNFTDGIPSASGWLDFLR